ncbi:MAG: WbqC family protein [Bacteroidota bacterium]
MTIFPVFYFPPIPWFVRAIQEKEILLDIHQPYRKQRYFSRMEILGPNQVIQLSIPIERRNKRLPLACKQISFAEKWRTQHWRSLMYSYKNSPYFPYYSDKLESIYTKKVVPLSEFLIEGIELCFTMIGMSPHIQLTQDSPPAGEESQDYRKSFPTNPTVLPEWFRIIPYVQVFEGFSPGLSILDLLFNLGPESREFLIESYIPM